MTTGHTSMSQDPTQETTPATNGHKPTLLDQFNTELERVMKDPHHTITVDLLKCYPQKLDEILRTTYLSSQETPVKNSIVPETVGQFRDRLVKEFACKFEKSPPFTLLRLAEVLSDPKRYYNSPDKFLRALETVTSVCSTVDDFKSSEKDDPAEQDKSNGHEEKMVPVTVGDESQTILLQKIDWLTEEDLKEVESVTYLADLTAPLNEAEGEEEGVVEEVLEEAVSEKPESEDEEKKRKAESHEVVDQSPEKRSKRDDAEKEDEKEDKKEDNEREVVNPDETLPEDKMSDESFSDKANETVVMEDVGDDTVADEKEEEVGNETLPEDKMDVD